MARTIITLDPEDKEWLDRRARSESVSMAELVRRAARRYRQEAEAGEPDLDTLLRKTSGLWKEGDGLAWQHRIRDEWAER